MNLADDGLYNYFINTQNDKYSPGILKKSIGKRYKVYLIVRGKSLDSILIYSLYLGYNGQKHH